LKIGIIGAGTMGVGIAQTFAEKTKYDLILCSSNIESARSGKERLENKLKERVNRGKINLEAAEYIISKIKIGVFEDCKECDVLIESIPENLIAKKNLFLKMQDICKPDCMFVTNTSSLSITEIGTNVLQAVIGMHFFNPAAVMDLVEITPGLNTEKDIIDRAIRLAKDLDKKPIVVKENVGFIVNRVLIPMINEAVGLYADGIAAVEEIDKAMKLGANHPMGPLQLGDFIGLDICLAIMEVLQKETGDSKYRPHPLLKKMVRGGWLGIKTGRGFYTYDNKN